MTWKELIESEKKFDPEELSSFLNSTITSTLQTEYYSKPDEQGKIIFNAHKLMMDSNREIYALSLLLPINDIHKQLIIFNLLKSGKEIPKEQKFWENRIISLTLKYMPTNRAYKLFTILQKNKVNNIRTRWLAKEFLLNRDNLIYETVKYRKWLKNLIIHNHLKPEGSTKEIFSFLFDKKPEVEEELLKVALKAKKDKEAVFKLPYSIAIGYKNLHKIPDEEFYEKIKGQMTKAEKLRLQETAKEAGTEVEVSLASYEPIKLLKYFRLATDKADLKVFEKACQRLAERIPFAFGKVAIIIDNSPSMYGSFEKKFHPISVAEAITNVMAFLSKKAKIYLTSNGKESSIKPFLTKLEGSSDLATALLNALKDEPEILIIISDGYENSPAGLAHQILQAYLLKILGKTMILHINPVYAPESKDIKTLHDKILTMGIRDTNQLMLILLIALAHFKKTKEIQKILEELRKKIAVPKPVKKREKK